MGFFNWFKPKPKIADPEPVQPVLESAPEPKRKGRPIGLRKNAVSQTFEQAVENYANTHVSDDLSEGNLNQGMQLEIIKRIAWYWKDAEIERYFAKEYNKSISLSNIGQYRKSEKWQPLIERQRDQYNTLILQVPIANKRNRLDQLQKQYDQVGDITNKDSRKEAREILKEAREEVERKVAGEISFNFTQVNHNEFHDMTEEDLQREKMKTIEQLERVRKLKLLTSGGQNGVGREGTPETIEITETEEAKEEVIRHE